MSDAALCIHGHFYQPPREDPWQELILPEGSAAPFRHWNERISFESYLPMAWARVLDGAGRIRQVVNCYEWMSFNFGPTLLRWMERSQPDAYKSVIEADARSLRRLGHGNAMAQVYHHVILPLASDLDRQAEIEWGVADFTARYGRRPEGMWLPEAAVDTRSLSLLAEAGIRYTVLAPRQAEAVAGLSADDWRSVDEGSLDASRPYLVELPEGRSIAVFFYNGPLSQAVAFEGLVKDGERFWLRLREAANSGLLSLATDGETYGHHFKFGEMGLAYVLDQGMHGRDGLGLTNFAAYLAANPPGLRARIRENSSWSCAHGVERWRADCGCVSDNKPGYNQRWRKPLRDGLNAFKAGIDRHYFDLGARLFKEPERALVEYGQALAGLESEAGFGRRHFSPRLSDADRDAGLKLLSMQRFALAAFASCAWFFDDIGRVEPQNALTFALRAVELAGRTGAPGLEVPLLAELKKARSNDPALGTGKDIWQRDVAPRQETPQGLAAQALLRLSFIGRMPGPGASARVDWPGVSVEVRPGKPGTQGRLCGEASILWRLQPAPDVFEFCWAEVEADPFAGRVEVAPKGGEGGTAGKGAQAGKAGKSGPPAAQELADLYWGKRQALALALAAHAEEQAWEFEAGHMASGAFCFLPFVPYQHFQTGAPKWARLWAGLAFAWITRPEAEFAGDKELQAFVRARAAGHPDRALLTARLGRLVRELVAQTRPDWTRIAQVVERARALDLEPDLWAAQNELWLKKRENKHDKGVAELLGFGE